MGVFEWFMIGVAAGIVIERLIDYIRGNEK